MGGSTLGRDCSLENESLLRRLKTIYKRKQPVSQKQDERQRLRRNKKFHSDQKRLEKEQAIEKENRRYFAKLKGRKSTFSRDAWKQHEGWDAQYTKLRQRLAESPNFGSSEPSYARRTNSARNSPTKASRQEKLCVQETELMESPIGQPGLSLSLRELEQQATIKKFLRMNSQKHLPTAPKESKGKKRKARPQSARPFRNYGKKLKAKHTYSMFVPSSPRTAAPTHGRHGPTRPWSAVTRSAANPARQSHRPASAHVSAFRTEIGEGNGGVRTGQVSKPRQNQELQELCQDDRTQAFNSSSHGSPKEHSEEVEPSARLVLTDFQSHPASLSVSARDPGPIRNYFVQTLTRAERIQALNQMQESPREEYTAKQPAEPTSKASGRPAWQ